MKKYTPAWSWHSCIWLFAGWIKGDWDSFSAFLPCLSLFCNTEETRLYHIPRRCGIPFSVNRPQNFFLVTFGWLEQDILSLSLASVSIFIAHSRPRPIALTWVCSLHPPSPCTPLSSNCHSTCIVSLLFVCSSAVLSCLLSSCILLLSFLSQCH